MAHSAETRTRVRTAYVRQRLDLKTAAAAHGVGYGTARRWRAEAEEAGDDWDRARAAARMADGCLGDLTYEVLEQFALLFQATIEELRAPVAEGDEPRNPIATAEALAKLADAYTKTVKAAGKVDGKMAELSVALRTLELFTAYLRERRPELLGVFADVLEPFGARLSEEFS